MKTFNKKRILLICSIVISLFFVLLILGKPFSFPVPPRIQFDTPINACFADDAALVLDQAGERLLFLDKDNKLKRIVKLDDSSAIDSVSLLTTDGEYFYLLGNKLKPNTDVVSACRIIRMDHDGKNPVTVLDFGNTVDEFDNFIVDLTIYEGDLYIVNETATSVDVTKYNIANHSLEEILSVEDPENYTSKYDPKSEILYINDYYGHLYKTTSDNQGFEPVLGDRLVENYLPTDDGELIWLDFERCNIYKNDQPLLENSNIYYGLFPCSEGLAFDNEDDTGFSILDFETGTISNFSSADFSLSYLLFSLICSICMLYLGILVIILIIRALRNMYSVRNLVRLKRVGIVAVLIIFAFVMSVVYTNKIVDVEQQHLKEDLYFYSHYFADSIDAQTLNDASYTPDIEIDPDLLQNYITACGKLEQQYDFFRGRLNEDKKNGSLTFYKKVDDKLVLVFESAGIMHIGSPIEYSSRESQINSNEIVRFAKSGYNKYYGMAPILSDDGEVIGAVEYAQDYRLTNANIRSTCIEMTVKLLSLFATIYIGLVELIEFIKNRTTRKMLIDKKRPNPEIPMIRNVSFLIFTIIYIDSVVVVFVAKKLLETSGIPETAFLLALPALMSGLGIIIAFTVFKFLSEHFYVKHIGIYAGIAAFVVRVCMTFTVAIGNFTLFCATKMIDGITLILLLCILQVMRVKSDSENERYRSSRQYSLGRISGIMMGALISGFLIQDTSKSVILYLISAILVIPLVVFLLIILPKKTIYIARAGKTEADNIAMVLKFFKDKSVILYFLCAMIPMYLIMGYQGYLFPLYSDTVHMPAEYVTTVFVMSRALLFMLSDSIEKLLKSIDHWKIATFSIGLIGIAFMQFAINSSIIWAMIMLCITGAAETIIIPATDVLWTRQAKANGIPLEAVSVTVSLTDEIISAFKESMISVFLLLGNDSACIAIGAFCVLAILIFMLYTRKKAMATA